MEYLMTYGWAILIIAIVMIAMFSLGIFNPSEPRVSAGACEVYHGNDVGECQGVWPQFVAKFDNPIGAPSGESTSNIIVANDPLLTAQNPPPFTVTLWYNINGAPTGSSTQYWDNLVSIPGYTGIEFINQGSNQASIFLHRCSSADTTGITEPYNTFFNGAWHFIGISFNPSNDQYFFQFDGSTYTTINSGGFGFTSGEMVIGGPNGCVYDVPFNGDLANLQLYNTSLSANSIQALYLEGIGGAPIDPTHIVGWWPLNGNAQDYSGNGNNGAATAVTYTSAWTSGYTQP